LDIDTKPDNPISLTVHLDDLNTIENESLTVNKTLIAVGTTNYNFSYQIAPEVFKNCGTVNPCVYDLEIYLLDDYGKPQDITYQGNTVQTIKRDSITGSSLDGLPYIFSARVSTGTYQIVKKLTPNQAAINAAVENWKENQTCVKKRIIEPITTCNPKIGRASCRE